MAYLTKAEYLTRFDSAETVNLTDPNGAAIDDAKLNAALEAASDIADSYAGARYGVPLDPTPDVIKEIVADLARERLHTLHPAEEVTDRADRARAMLRDIAKGVMVLVDADGLVSGDAADIPVIYKPDQVFTDKLLDSFKGRMAT